ncbi:MAG: aldehyde ferredoxin oxidoreductase N-terminal domain-containing protein [Thermodesulfobacteriota bacterium]
MENEYGYTGKILKVNLSSGQIEHLPTARYADRFVGGRGLAAKLYWDLVPPEADAFDSRNVLIFVTGPVAGFGSLSGSRWQVCGKSPASDPHTFSYSNMGGHWGTQLKFAGYDGLVVEGASDKPVYLSIKNDQVEIKNASSLWQKPAVEVRQGLKETLGREVRVLATGPAGDNRVVFAGLLADGDASGSSGFGAVMGSKKLKAIAVQGDQRKFKAADTEKLRELTEYVRQLKKLKPGTLEKLMPEGSGLKREACFGCIGSCIGRMAYQAEDGTHGKVMCQSGMYYIRAAWKHYGKRTEVPFYANRIADSYGFDTMVVDSIITLLFKGHKTGIFTEENTELPLSQIGSLEFIEALAKKISFREGIGDILAQGTTRAAAIIGQGAPDLIADQISIGDHGPAYCPRMYITTGLFYATEPRQPIQNLHCISRPTLKWVSWLGGNSDSHMTTDLVRWIAKTYWGSEEAADFSTYNGKALAAKMIQDREYAKESLILCDFAWPITDVDCTEDHQGDPTVESRIYSAVTGRQTDEAGLNEIGERIFNLQRAILTREGHVGREADKVNEMFFTVPLKEAFLNPECLVPGPGEKPVSKKGTVFDREKFEAIKTEYYHLRGWDPNTGLQTEEKLQQLGLEDLTGDLNKKKLFR